MKHGVNIHELFRHAHKSGLSYSVMFIILCMIGSVQSIIFTFMHFTNVFIHNDFQRCCVKSNKTAIFQIKTVFVVENVI